MKSVITGIAIFLGIILMFVLLGGFYPNNSKGYKDTQAQSQKLKERQKEYILSKKSQINLTASCPNKRGSKKDENSLLRETLKSEYETKAVEVKNENRALNAAKKELLIAKESLAHKKGELQKLKSQLMNLKENFKSSKIKTQKELAKVDELNEKYLQQKKRYENANNDLLEAQNRIKSLQDELRMKDDRLQMLKSELLALKKELKSLQSNDKKVQEPLNAVSIEKPHPPKIEIKDVTKKEEAQKKTIIAIDKKIQEILSLRKVEFKSGSSQLTRKSKKILLSVAKIIKKNSNFHYLIQGHTDSSGNEKFNLHLSDKRAKRVKAYLVELGVDQNILRAEGFGSKEPIADNSTKEGRIKNRRVVIKIEK